MTQPAQQQEAPGTDSALQPAPEYGEKTYKGSGRLTDKVALITGADSGIGKAVALAFAREGADVVISYLNEHDDAEQTRQFVTDAGRRALLVPGDLSNPRECRALVDAAVREFGRIDVLVHNAAFQQSRESLEDIPDEEWDRTLAVNLSAYFHLAKAGIAHMGQGASIIATSSVQSDAP